MIAELFWMDGYGPYVWAAWVVTALAAKGLLAFILAANECTRRELEQLESEQQSRSVESD